MQFKKGENFQSSDAQLIWNKIGNFNNGFKATKPPPAKVRYWSWGQVVGKAVNAFNRVVSKANRNPVKCDRADTC